MMKTTVKVSGMRCGMCEAHLNDAIRSVLPIKKVRSSRSKGETVILSEAPLDREVLRQTINATGYIMLSASEEAIKKKSLFATLLRR